MHSINYMAITSVDCYAFLVIQIGEHLLLKSTCRHRRRHQK